jgi:single-strand DNA-binding protein
MSGSEFEPTNVAIVKGRLSGPPRRRELPSGSVLVELDVTTRGESGSCTVPIAWFDPDAVADSLEQDEPVVVVGYVRRRFFRSGGATQSRTEVVAQRVIPAARRAQVSRALAGVAASIVEDSDESATVRSTARKRSR